MPDALHSLAVILSRHPTWRFSMRLDPITGAHYRLRIRCVASDNYVERCLVTLSIVRLKDQGAYLNNVLRDMEAELESGGKGSPT